MQARFNIEREKTMSLFYKSYPNSYCHFQFHAPIELWFLEAGEMEMLVNGKQRTLQAPAVSVALSYDTHAYRTPVSSHSTLLIIPTQLCEEFTQAVHGKRLADPFITDPEVYAALRACYVDIAASEKNKIKQIGAIYTLLGTLLEHLTLVDAEEEINTGLASQILFYIDQNHTADVTPRAVTRHFGYTQSYISRLFSTSFGITLSHYITIVRLRHALSLMRGGKHNITYCALEAGFASMRTFYRSFHDEFGVSPTDFIKNSSDEFK